MARLNDPCSKPERSEGSFLFCDRSFEAQDALGAHFELFYGSGSTFNAFRKSRQHIVGADQHCQLDDLTLAEVLAQFAKNRVGNVDLAVSSHPCKQAARVVVR